MRAPYPGMDRKVCPDLASMQRLFDSGSFSWTGYYFAPTHAAPGKDRSWMGQRATLVEQGWGLAPIYWGFQQDDNHVANWANEDDARVQARADSLEAAMVAFQEGFPDNTTIFLDVEASLTPSTGSFVAYVDEWLANLPTVALQMPNHGTPPQFFPGIYLHRRDITDDTYGAEAANATRWLVGGPAVNGVDALDPWGWPKTPKPDDVGEPCSMWQWGLGVVLERRGNIQVGYRFTDYDGIVREVLNDLDYDSSWTPDPSRTSGDGVINDVMSVSSLTTGSTILGGTDAAVLVRLSKPAARPLGVDVVVTDGKHSVRSHLAPGDREVRVVVPTDPVDIETMVKYSARTEWWRFSREHAGMTSLAEPPAHFTTITLRPPRILHFTISPKVKVNEKGSGTVVLEGIPTSDYRVQLRSASKVNDHMLLKDVPADVAFASEQATFEFKGAWGTRDGVTATIQALFWGGNTVANSTVLSE